MPITASDLLGLALLPGQNELSEKGLTVRLAPTAGALETILCFKIDGSGVRSAMGRVGQGWKTADAIVLWTRAHPSQRGSPMPNCHWRVLIVELKGSNRERAKRQLAATVNEVRQHLTLGRPVTIDAVIAERGRATPPTVAWREHAESVIDPTREVRLHVRSADEFGVIDLRTLLPA